MTRDEIIDLAHQLDVLDTQHYGTLWVDKLARFADVVERAARKQLKPSAHEVRRDSRPSKAGP